MRFVLVFVIGLAGAMLLGAQGTEPKTSASDYPVHIQLDSVTLAAEYLVHSIPAIGPTKDGVLIARDYLVVEVAFYGPPSSRLSMSQDHFTLRVNGKGMLLSPEIAGIVAGSIKFPENTLHPGLTASGGVSANGGTIGAGPQPPGSQFPGDGNDRVSQPTLSVQKQQEDTIEYRVQNSALPEGERSLPRSGLLYFPYRGRTKNIHSLELIYDGKMGKATLKLLPETH